MTGDHLVISGFAATGKYVMTILGFHPPSRVSHVPLANSSSLREIFEVSLHAHERDSLTAK